jgi:hypothetical protein
MPNQNCHAHMIQVLSREDLYDSVWRARQPSLGGRGPVGVNRTQIEGRQQAARSNSPLARGVPFGRRHAPHELFPGSDLLCQMDRKQLVGSVLAKANKYRNFTRWISDGETVQRILALAEKLQRRASALAKPSENRVRRRAREIWEKNGRPYGRDEEFWFQAEREFREAENLTKENQ